VFPCVRINDNDDDDDNDLPCVVSLADRPITNDYRAQRTSPSPSGSDVVDIRTFEIWCFAK